MSSSDKKQKKTRSKDITWSKNERWLGRIITYLTDQPGFRHQYFSDWAKQAKTEGRKRQVGKDSKKQMHLALATYVFKDDEDADIRARFAAKPGDFADSLANQINGLATKYKAAIYRLGKTGAGLAPNEMSGDIRNIFELISNDIPYFRELHEWWHRLPNYNPLHVSNSSAGQDSSQQVLDLMGLGDRDSEEVTTPNDGEKGVSAGTEGIQAWDDDLNGIQLKDEDGGGTNDEMEELTQTFNDLKSPTTIRTTHVIPPTSPRSSSIPPSPTQSKLPGDLKPSRSLSSLTGRVHEQGKTASKRDPLGQLVGMRMADRKMREQELDVLRLKLQLRRESESEKARAKGEKRKRQAEATESNAKRKHEMDKLALESQTQLQLAQIELQRVQSQIELAKLTHNPFA